MQDKSTVLRPFSIQRMLEDSWVRADRKDRGGYLRQLEPGKQRGPAHLHRSRHVAGEAVEPQKLCDIPSVPHTAFKMECNLVVEGLFSIHSILRTRERRERETTHRPFTTSLFTLTVPQNEVTVFLPQKAALSFLIIGTQPSFLSLLSVTHVAGGLLKR
jgi:hypothetical protein